MTPTAAASFGQPANKPDRVSSLVHPTAWRVGSSILLLVAAADWLFYGERAGISVSVFGGLLTAVLIANRPKMVWGRTTVIGLLLLIGALLQAADSFNFRNLVVLGLLFSAAMVEQEGRLGHFRPAAWPMAMFAGAKALGRWIIFIRMIDETMQTSGLDAKCTLRFFWRLLKLLAPVIAIAVPFFLLLASGNALMAAHWQTLIDSLGRVFQWMKLPGIGRLIFWGITATCALTFLVPAVDLRVAELCIEKWPSFPPASDESLSRWRTWLILAVLNGLFFWANAIDAFFLWSGAKLPTSVSYSVFVHQGVYSLIATTILSSAVLILLSQQDEHVASASWSKGLSLLCIAQNLFLISSVALRLKLYVEAYDLSILRFYVGAFLVLLTVGYGLLIWRILLGKSLNWLVVSNGAAVFGLYYILQFIDVAGYVAHYNTEQWLEHRKSVLDLEYLKDLGPSAWPALIRLTDDAAGTPEAQMAAAALQYWKTISAREKETQSWRSWQWQKSRLQNEVFSIPPGPVKPAP